MRAYVYTDKGLERYAGRFVWLSINTEDAKNAAFLKSHPIPVLPTILILDPRGSVTVRYIGGATVPQLKKLLDEAETRHRTHTQSVADRYLRTADQYASSARHADAVRTYEDAIKVAPRDWPRFGRAAESLVFELAMLDDPLRCATRALELYPRVEGSTSAANVASTGLSCATGIDKESARSRELLDALEKATREVFDDQKIVVSDDDRSGLYIALIDARDAAGDEERVIALKAEWAAFLEGAAARAKTPEQRAVYDSHRLTAYLDLGTPEKAIPMLEQSERDFPDDYNPPARLALAYKAMKEYDKALAASDRALQHVYGPRRLTVLSARADIFLAKGDRKAARETIIQAIDYAKALPEGQRSARRIASLEKRLAGMGGE
jgi:tetratricopeptide (TPR) repeat protein